GYDVEARRWPDWIAAAGMRMELLPRVVEPGDVTGALTAAAAEPSVVPATTTTSRGKPNSSAAAIGDGVTALGSSLTIKILSDRSISAPRFGIYSHRLGNAWL
ncbi:carbohydrate kinase, partial [Mesorhizobium sp. M7D.F.Ca.US.004.01.2.1]